MLSHQHHHYILLSTEDSDIPIKCEYFNLKVFVVEAPALHYQCLPHQHHHYILLSTEDSDGPINCALSDILKVFVVEVCALHHQYYQINVIITFCYLLKIIMSQ